MPERELSTIGDVDRNARAELGAEFLVDVVLRVKPRPDEDDRRRGCTDQIAYYFGTCLEQGSSGAAELPDPERPVGEVVVFLERLQPLTPRRLLTVLRHEYHHALGFSEEEIQAMGHVLEDVPVCGRGNAR